MASSRFRAVLMVVVAVVFPGVVRGQSRALPGPARVRTLTLAEAVRIARRNPPAVLSAMARARAAEAQVAVARSSLLPSVTTTVSGNAFFSNGGFVSPVGVLGGTTGLSGSLWLDGSVNARWTIWDFGRTVQSVHAAEQGADAARWDVRTAERVAMGQAAAAYYVVLSDGEMIAQARETLRQRERQLEIARGLVETGVRPPIEQTRAEVARDTARLDLTVAEATARNDCAALAAALALDPTVELNVLPPPEISVDDDPVRAAERALAHRYEITAARARLSQAEAQLAAARAGYLPTLGVSASGSVRYTERVNAPGGGLSEIASAGVSLSVPVFDPVVNANVRAAEANVSSARATLDQQILTVRTEAVQSAIAVRSARQALAQAERVAAGAAANLVQAEGRYAAGAASLLELVDAQAADANARVGVVRARLQLGLAQVRLLTAIGTIEELTRLEVQQ